MKMHKGHSWIALRESFSEDLLHVLLQQHHAAQFIALVGRHLVPHRPDDSHTNMQFLTDREWLIGNELPSGQRIALQLSDLTLCIVEQGNDIRARISLAGVSKQEVFDQLKKSLADLNINVNPLKDELHYSLPAHELDQNGTFSIGNQGSVGENILYRRNADFVIGRVASNFKDADPVRIWPHHFDTGTFIPLGYNKGGDVSKSIGLGWAIPDGMVSEPYYYLSFWSKDPVEHFNALPDPETGEWIRSGWQGGVARTSDIVKIPSARGQQAYVETFFQSGIELIRKHFNV